MLDLVFGHLSPTQLLSLYSTSTYLSRWNALLGHFGLPHDRASGGATPSVLRGSSVTGFYIHTEDIPRAKWCGRWRGVTTLESYLQEAAHRCFLLFSSLQLESFCSSMSPVARQLSLPFFQLGHQPIGRFWSELLRADCFRPPPNGLLVDVSVPLYVVRFPYGVLVLHTLWIRVAAVARPVRTRLRVTAVLGTPLPMGVQGDASYISLNSSAKVVWPVISRPRPVFPP